MKACIFLLNLKWIARKSIILTRNCRKRRYFWEVYINWKDKEINLFSRGKPHHFLPTVSVTVVTLTSSYEVSRSLEVSEGAWSWQCCVGEASSFFTELLPPSSFSHPGPLSGLGCQLCLVETGMLCQSLLGCFTLISPISLSVSSHHLHMDDLNGS